MSGRVEPIAIVGVGCRLPGADGPEAFWHLLRDGRDAITEVPPDRWDAAALYDPDPRSAGHTTTKWGGFLTDIDRFDARFFGIAPREADQMDPQQRLLLEVAWEALEHAGIAPDALRGTDTAVFVGVSGHDYAQMIAQTAGHLAAITPHSGTGNAQSIVANRLSYLLDLRGPSLAIDTACSSSLVAVHLACESLGHGTASLAIAGGVNVILRPETTVAFSRARMMAADGRCKPFAADADGYVRAEGCGVVVLKRLSDARRDGDAILAIVRGTAVNQDGRTAGLTVPSEAAQVAVMRAALAAAGLPPSAVDYVEAHGTGTPVGDPIEMRALTAVLGEGTSPCVVGSSKANVGHLESASGIAGLIKVVLCLAHESIPPQIHLARTHPEIALDGTRLRLARTPQVWRRGSRPRIAGVNSFGFGGTNAHLVIEEPPAAPAPAPERAAHVIVLSARTEAGLSAAAGRLAAHLAAHPGAALADVAHTLAVGRARAAVRLAFAAESVREARERLAAFAAGRALDAVPVDEGRLPRVAFLFTGQGAQRAGMGRRLYAGEPVFRAALDRCAARLDPVLARPLLEVMHGDDGRALDDAAFAEPALFALQWALASQLAAWGIRPDAVLGHGAGEIVAACVAGALDLEAALGFVAARAALLRTLPRAGATAVALASEARVAPVVDRFAGRLAIAAVNGPAHVVLSGERDAVHLACARLTSEGVSTRPLAPADACHSPRVEPVLDALEAEAARCGAAPSRLPLASAVTGTLLPAGTTLAASHWRQQARGTVRFADGVARLASAGYDVLVEVGPEPALVDVGRRAARASCVWVPTLTVRTHDDRALADAVATLVSHGVAVDWRAIDPAPRRRLALPTTPFERSRHWAVARDATPGGTAVEPEVHPLLGRRLHSAQAGAQFEARLSTARLAWLADHRIQGAICVPATAFVEMALAAAELVHGGSSHAVVDLTLHAPLLLSADAPRTVQLLLSPPASGEATFQVSAATAEGGWTTHASGRVGPHDGRVEAAPPDAVRAPTVPVSPDALYGSLAAHGLDYGPAFRGVVALERTDGRAHATVALPPGLAADGDGFAIHPALLDACFHAVAAALPAGTGGACLPVGIDTIRVHAASGPVVSCVATVREGHDLVADVRLSRPDGTRCAEVTGLRLRPLSRGDRDQAATEAPVHRLVWEPAPSPPAAASARGRFVLLADRGGFASSLAAVLAARDATVVVVQPSAALPPFPRDAAADVVVVDLRALDATPAAAESAVPADATRGAAALLALVQALAAAGSPAPRLVVVTRGAQAVPAAAQPIALAAAALWGLGRTVANEHPELAPLLVDLDPAADASEFDVLADVLSAPTDETQLAVRAGQRLVARLTPADAHEERLAVPTTPSWALESARPGQLAHLVLVPRARPALEAGQVEIAVEAVGLNFRDVMNAMGLYPGAPIAYGAECAGRVVRTGTGVESLSVGERVLAIAPACFGRHAVAADHLVVRIPDHLTYEDAATIPVAFLTASYALDHLGRMAPGERVLVHAAAGGVGLAAVRLALRAGCEVFATAGSEPKRDALRALGVGHVMDSRSFTFADEVLAATGGRGVDLVLNSLPGPFVARSLGVLAPYGRFLEIGKTDIFQNAQLGLSPFRNNLSYHAIDLDRVCRERPALARTLLRDLVRRFAVRELEPLPRRTFPIAEAIDAFRHMAQRRNVGKVIVRTEPPSTPVADGTYLVTGGTGALGLAVAERLVARGARHLLLVARRPPGAHATAVVERIRAAGATVVVDGADVGDPAALAALLARAGGTMPPLRGVFHAAGVLDDARLRDLDARRLADVLAPKIAGAWNLHLATRDLPLDHFVLYSSIAGLLGSPGQAAYAAANAFLDGLAHHRRALGLVATAIAWGPWAGEGLAMRGRVRETLALSGFDFLPPAAALDALERLIAGDSAAVVVARADWRKLSGVLAVGTGRLLAALAGPAHRPDDPAAPAPAGDLRATLLAADAAQRPALVVDRLRAELARVVGLAPGEIDAEASFDLLGLDSLMMLELKDDLETGLDIVLPLESFLEGPSITTLAERVVALVGTKAAA